MKPRFHVVVVCVGLVLGSVFSMAAPNLSSLEIYKVVRSGSVAEVGRLIEEGVPVNYRDAAGNSLLMQAVVYGDTTLASFLIQRGADVNTTNNFGATALMRAAGDHEKIALLVKHGAKVNARSGLMNSALHTAAREHRSARSVELLLKAGAEVNATNVFGATPLMCAAASGDLETVRLLVKHGADVNAHSRGSEANVIWGGGRSALMWAAFRGDKAMAKFLIEAGANVNEPEGFGTALSQAAWNDHAKMAEFLLKRAAQVNQKDVMAEFTPLHWAAGSENGDAALVKLLLRHGADANAEGGAPVDAFMGIPQTPLLIAKKRNETAIAQELRAAGATEKAVKTRAEVSMKAVEVNQGSLRAALVSALPKLEETAVFSKGAYLQHSSKQDCVSCHQQYMPLASFGFAKVAGARADAKVEAQVVEFVRKDNTNLYEMTAQATFHPEPGHGYGYALFSMEAQDQEPSPELDAMVHHLLVIQDKDGQWHNNLPRPPLQTSDFGPTALAIRALKKYGFPGREAEIGDRIARAKKWLSRATPRNTEERAYQLAGLAWAGESQKKLHALAKELLKEQRSNGGWAQLASLEPDAYATGLTLFALAQAREKNTTEFQRGLAFLLSTQAKDGTWHVRARAYPFQPTMRSGYPYSRDGWISATGASWAVMAIASALEETKLQMSAR
ncbi:MAG TPA: ankyrin repeat domain-containing protein [Verrucomicrobiae bacterium]